MLIFLLKKHFDQPNEKNSSSGANEQKLAQPASKEEMQKLVEQLEGVRNVLRNMAPIDPSKESVKK
jgi:hypothetical protein